MFKKILLCLPKDSSYYSGLTRALKFLNLDYQFFDTRAYSLGEKLIATIGQNRATANSFLNNRLVSEAKKFQPDCLITMKGEMISKKTIDEIKKNNIRTVNWFPDHVDALDLAFDLSEVYDYFFHFDPYAIENLKKRNRKNIYYLPFASDIIPGDKIPSELSKKYKVSFIGNYNSRREKIFDEISALGLSIWGDQRWGESKLKNNYLGPLPNLKVKEILTSSEIGLNVQHDFPCDGAVLRVFETLESNCFLMSENRKDLHRLFKIDKDLCIFADGKDLQTKLLYFLSHREKRLSVAQNGYNAVSHKQTYVDRLEQMFSQIR